MVDELSAIVASLPIELWHQPVDPGADTPHYILQHLLGLEARQFSSQLPHFLASEPGDLEIFDAQAWMAANYTPEEPASSIMEQLRDLRLKELAWLHSLPVDGWSRIARHPWYGEHTLQWWVELQLEVTLQYLAQLRGLRAP